METELPAVPAADAGLVARLRSGDAETFDAVVRDLSPAMLRVARNYVQTEASAQDVVQEAWLAVIRGLPRFEGRSTLRTWVFAILVNLARRRGRADRRVVPLSSLADDGGPLVDPDRFFPAGHPDAGAWRPQAAPQAWGPEAQALGAEVRELLRVAMDRLPQRQRDVLALRDIHHLPTEEVADLLDVSPGNVRVLLHRARARLRESLADYYHGPTAEVRR